MDGTEAGTERELVETLGESQGDIVPGSPPPPRVDTGSSGPEERIAVDNDPASEPSREAVDSIDRLVAAVTDARDKLGIDVDVRWGVEQLQAVAERRTAARDKAETRQIEQDALLGQKELAILRLQGELQSRDRDIDARLEKQRRELEAQGATETRTERLAYRETWVRFILALLLVAGTLGIVLTGVIGNQSPEEVAQYVAPIAGLSGIAIGYFFGRSSQ